MKYTYNANSLKEELINARGHKRTFTYDAIGRIVGWTSIEDSASYTYDANGNILTATDMFGTVRRTYDALNRVSSYTDQFGYGVGYEYDEVGNLKKVIYPEGSEVVYDCLNYL